MAWGLGTEAQAPAEVGSIRRQQRDRLLKLNPKAAAAETQALTARQQSWFGLAATGIGMVTGVRSGLRRPQRLTVLAIVGEAPAVMFYAPRAARAVQRRKPRAVSASWSSWNSARIAAWSRVRNSHRSAAFAAVSDRATAR